MLGEFEIMNKENTSVSEIYDDEIDDFFDSLTVISERNIKRILENYTLFNFPIDLTDANKPYYFQYFLAQQSAKKEQIKLRTFFLKYYEKREIIPPSLFPELDFKNLDLSNFPSKSAQAMNSLAKDIKLLYGVDFRSGEKEEKSFYDRSLTKGEKLTISDLDTIEYILKSYKQCFEYFVIRLMNEDFKKYVSEVKEGLHNTLLNDRIINKALNKRKVTYNDLLTFFRKIWKEEPIKPYLTYFKPLIRNSIAHDNWEPNFSSQELLFKNHKGEIKRRIPMFQFASHYLSKAQTIYGLLSLEYSYIKTFFKFEKECVEQIRGKETKLVGKQKLAIIPYGQFLSPQLSVLATFYNSFIVCKESDNDFEKLANSFLEYFLEGLSVQYLPRVLPILFRYIISKYPYNKPTNFKKKIAQQYHKWVKLKLIDDDENIVKQFIIEMSS